MSSGKRQLQQQQTQHSNTLDEPANKKHKSDENFMSNVNHIEDKLAFENRNSRVIGAIGADALKKFLSSSVLLIGMRGLGAEIAKNVVLFGVKRLCLYDPQPVTIEDLGSNFFLTESDVGKNRAEACLPKVVELNDRVAADVYNGQLNKEFISQFKIVVATNIGSRSRLIELNEVCRQSGANFIAADTYGLFGAIFVDFGDAFEIHDKDGEQPKQCYIHAVMQDTLGTVHVVDSKRHDLEDNDLVRLYELDGMNELNNREFRVKVVGPFTFTIGVDTSNMTPYKKGGQMQQVKEVIKQQFKPLRQAFTDPQWDKILITDESKGRRHLYVIVYQALLQFQEQHHRLPRPYNDEDANEVLRLANQINSSELSADAKQDKLEDTVVRLIASTAAGELNPMTAFFGGIIGQEVIKAATGKFTPIPQWFGFDSLECLPAQPLTEADVKLQRSRYDSQIAVFGNAFVERVRNLRYFLVGAGAIGCEMLKNWAMIGVGSGERGLVQITDMDTIEVSNLSRQFLFRPWDITKFKSQVAAAAAQRMNPHMHVKHHTMKVADDTEVTFNDDFWTSLDGVTNALDNVQARLYVDRRCIFFGKSLLESGTLGTKGNVQVIVPGVTESYGSSQDPPPKETALCLLHSFPNNIQHCLQWGREVLFEGYFTKDMEITNNFAKNANYIATLPPTQKLATLRTLEATVINRPQTFDDCVRWARLVFEEYYTQRLMQLIHTYPPDMITENKLPFWSGAKRAPTPLQFNIDDPMHLEFVLTASMMRAYNFGLIESEYKPADIAQWTERVRKVSVTVQAPKFQPKGGVKIDTDESADPKKKEKEMESAAISSEEEQEVDSIMNRLPAHDTVKPLRVIEFEKDDDRNFHVDFITAASNLRAVAYKIPPVDRLESKLIAGKIIPAIVTTTALVTGLVCLEFYKIQQGHKKIDLFRNAFVNLALPLFQQSEPIAPPKMKFEGKEFTLWDKIVIKKGDMTLKQLIDYIASELKVEVDVLSIGSLMVYTSWMPKAKREERMPRRVVDVVADMTQKPVEPHVTHFQLNITGSDADGNDIEHMPEVYYYFK